MPEGDVRQPVDADMDVRGGFRAARDIEVAAARCSRADEDGVIAFRKNAGEAVDARPEARLDAAHVENVIDLLVNHGFRQAETRYLAPDHAAAAGLQIVKDKLVAERREVAGDGQRCRTGADQGDALAVSCRRRLGQAIGDVGLVVGGDPLQAADRHRLGLDPAAAARGSHGRSQVLPRMPGKTLEYQLTM